MDGNDLVASFVANTRYETLPPEVQRKAKLCLLDNLGATLSGTLTAISDITAAYAAQAWKGDEATILLRGLHTTAAGAAFANGYAANGLDIDDIGRWTRGHPGAQLFPTALAVAEKLDASGAEMLAALVVGYEVAIRAARCWHHHHDPFYQCCGSWGSVANAAVAARLMGLGCDQIKHALGIAEYHAPNLPMMRDIDHPTMVKHGIGWGAMNGVVSAELAVRGFTGIPSLLGFPEYLGWISTIGHEYLTLSAITFKRYAACGWGHPSLAAAQKVMRDNAIAVADIAHIRVEGFHETTRLWVRHPRTEEEAQFSVAWPLAALLIDGEIGPEQMLPQRYGDPEILALADKVELVESSQIDALYRPVFDGADDPDACAAAAVEITLNSGTRYNSGIVRGEEGPGSFWSEEEVERKFRRFTGYVLEQERIDKLVAMVWDCDSLPSVRQLTALVASATDPLTLRGSRGA